MRTWLVFLLKDVNYEKLGQENEGQGPRSNTNMQQFDTVLD